MQTGARIQALKQLFNARQGIPPRHPINLRAIGLPSLSRGANRDRTLNLDQMIQDYWTASGWDPETGLPTQATLSELGLSVT
jgi:aldehyde:ferredoxin oxidoreductase